ncbi:MAG: hypothetical protein MMC23_004681 [Stictis urceolatum]|nr:hypothetical protein [Stictis urceolata]
MTQRLGDPESMTEVVAPESTIEHAVSIEHYKDMSSYPIPYQRNSYSPPMTATPSSSSSPPGAGPAEAPPPTSTSASSSSEPHPLLSASSDALKAHIGALYDSLAPRYLEWTASHDPTRLKWLSALTERLLPQGFASTPGGMSAPDSTTEPSAGTSKPSAQSGPPLRILEIGCGAGIPGTKILTSLPGARVVGNDISAGQIELARTNLSGEIEKGSAELRAGDMLALEFEEGSLDAVVGLYSIIHLPREEQRVMLGKIGRWLREGGWLMVNFSGVESEGLVARGWLAGGKDGGEGEGKEGGKGGGGAEGAGGMVSGAEGDMYWSGWSPEDSKKRVEEAGMRVRVAEMDGMEDGIEFLWVLAEKISE